MSSLKQHLLSGGKSYGPFLMSDSPTIAELMAGVGYGHIVIDQEHSPADVRSSQVMLQAIRSGNSDITPIIRVASPNDPVTMKKVLDTLKLPGGILVPFVEDAEMAKQVVRSTRYPRQLRDDEKYEGGIRGFAAPDARATGWGVGKTVDEYLKQCKEDLLIMVQVETAKGVENIAEIAAVDGIDVIFIGPFDLSCSMGQMGKFDNKSMQEILSKAEKAVNDASSCLLGGFRSSGRDLKEMFASGYSLVCGSVDVGLLRDAARKDFEAGKKAIAETTTTTTKRGSKNENLRNKKARVEKTSK